MLILRRALSWLAETICATVMIGLWLRMYLGAEDSPEPRFVIQWWYYMQMTLFVFMLGSGYLITTAVCAVSPLRGGPLWLYPASIAALFSIHLWFFSGAWISGIVVPIYVGGATIAVLSAFVGNWALRRGVLRIS